MVHGIDKFREYFSDYTGHYVLIGGAACDILLNRANADFRATKDLDVVLILEIIDGSFVERFVDFVEIGGYQHIKKGSGKEQYYRFQNPADNSFPAMIELFSRKPENFHTFASRLAPIHISDDVISLSAILLNDDYYSLIRTGRTEVDNISVLQTEYIILFKMRAWLDLSERICKRFCLLTLSRIDFILRYNYLILPGKKSSFSSADFRSHECILCQ